MSRILRILTLLAVMLMPLGMAAPAEAHGTMDMAMTHCPDRAPAHRPKSIFAECTMACASALPAVERVADEALPRDRADAVFLAEHPLSGLHPETATPPPKLA